MKSNAMNVNNIFKNSLSNNSYYKNPSGKLSVNTTSTVKKENKEIKVKSDSRKIPENANNVNKENNAFNIMNDYLYQRSKGSNNVFNTNNISSTQNDRNKIKEMKRMSKGKSKGKSNNRMESLIDSNQDNDYYQYGYNYLAEQINYNAYHYDIIRNYNDGINNNIDYFGDNNLINKNNEENFMNIMGENRDKGNINGINKIDCVDANNLMNNNNTRSIVKKNYSINRKFPRKSIISNDLENTSRENHSNSKQTIDRNNINSAYLLNNESNIANTVSKNNINLPINRNRSVHLENRSSVNAFDYNNNNTNIIDSLLKITNDTNINNANNNISRKTDFDRNSINNANKQNDLINNRPDNRIVRDSLNNLNSNNNNSTINNQIIINRNHNLANSTSISISNRNQNTRTNQNNHNTQNNETRILRRNNNDYNNIYSDIYEIEELNGINSIARNEYDFNDQIANRLINYNDYNDSSINDDIRIDPEDLYSISNIDVDLAIISLNSNLDSIYDLTNHETKGFSESEIKLIPARKFANDLKQDSCVICMEAIKLNEDIRIFSCNHFFHINCIDSWLLKKRNCPLCKKSISLHK